MKEDDTQESGNEGEMIAQAFTCIPKAFSLLVGERVSLIASRWALCCNIDDTDCHSNDAEGFELDLRVDFRLFFSSVSLIGSSLLIIQGDEDLNIVITESTNLEIFVCWRLG